MKKELREEIKRSEELGNETQGFQFSTRNVLIGTAVLGGIGAAAYFLTKTLSNEEKKQKAINFFKDLGQREPFNMVSQKFQSVYKKQA